MNLNFIQSDVPIVAANETNSEIIGTSDVQTSVGAGDIIAYTTTVFGSGYFALTDAVPSLNSSNVDNSIPTLLLSKLIGANEFFLNTFE